MLKKTICAIVVAFSALIFASAASPIFPVERTDIDGVTRRFAAGEFSNCVWGFYLKRTNERSVAP